jgi:hypothetical protein
MPAISSQNKEICDGLDNDDNGIPDDGLISNCYYPGVELSFKTCYPCPASTPKPGNPVPVTPGSTFRFATECPIESSFGIFKV